MPINYSQHKGLAPIYFQGVV